MQTKCSKMKIVIDKEFRALIPPLAKDERDQLESNIVADGCRDPLVVWGNVLLDGHNRYDICTRHRIPFETVVVELADRDAAADWIDRNQLGRRNLTPDQFKVLLGRRYNRTKKTEGRPSAKLPQNEGETAERLAKEHGVSRATVERAGELAEAVDMVKATEPEIVAKGEGAILKAAKEIKKKKRVERVQKREAQTIAALETKHPLAGACYKLIHGDLLDATDSIEDESVDAIITDPPYPAEFLPVYSKMCRLAERVLRPGGRLIAMVGQANFPAVIAAMTDSELTYQWTLAYVTPGQSTQVFGRKIKSNWKPLLYFTKGKSDWEHVDDVIKSSENDKRFHDWGQSVGGMAEIIERFTTKGSLILDPFVGGGTTGVACLLTKRLFIGIDIDKGCVAKSAGRLKEVA